MHIRELAEKLHCAFCHRSDRSRPFIVGVDGLGGAGKTTFSESIEREMHEFSCSFRTFHLDDHIVARDKRYHTGHESWYEYYYLQWDVSGLAKDLLEPLHCSRKLFLPFYKKCSDTISSKQVEILPDSIVLIEGIFLQREEWRRYFDFIVFLDCPDDIRRERVLARDAYLGNDEERLKKYTERYWPAEEHYTKKTDPCINADLVLNIFKI